MREDATDMVMAMYEGVVKGNKVLLKKGAALPDGTKVVVTPVEFTRGSSQAILAALDASPHPTSADVEELRRLIAEGKQPARYDDPFKRARTKTKRKRRQ
jgi:hypothetical protein